MKYQDKIRFFSGKQANQGISKKAGQIRKEVALRGLKLFHLKLK
jgi:hypothetical protein